MIVQGITAFVAGIVIAPLFLALSEVIKYLSMIAQSTEATRNEMISQNGILAENGGVPQETVAAAAAATTDATPKNIGANPGPQPAKGE